MFTERNDPGHREEVWFCELLKFTYRVREANEDPTAPTSVSESWIVNTAVLVHSEEKYNVHLIAESIRSLYVAGKLPVLLYYVVVDISFGLGFSKITPGIEINNISC